MGGAGELGGVSLHGDVLRVVRSTEAVDELRIVDLGGRTLLKTAISGTRAEVSLASVPRGAYLVEFGTGTTFGRKMIVRN